MSLHRQGTPTGDVGEGPQRTEESRPSKLHTHDVEMWRKCLSNPTLLISEGATIEGVHIWGSPVTRVDGAFGMPDEAERDALYSEIPGDPA
jgi:hypothetical protein